MREKNNVNELGKALPQAVEVEEAVLGAMLIDHKAIDEVLMILRSEQAFYKEEHRNIFKAICELYRENEQIDILTVSQKLRRIGKLEEVGGDYYLVQLTQKVASSAHVHSHSRILQQQMLRRMIIDFSSRVVGMAYDEAVDVFELMAKWSGEFDKVNEFVLTGRTTIGFPEALRELGKRVEMLTNRGENYLDGVHTGYESINRHTGGWKPGNLIIVGARPGMGKTAFVLRTVLENIMQGNPVGMISLEMDIVELTARLVAINTNFHLSQLIKKGFEKESYFDTFSKDVYRMEKLPFYVDDSGKSDVVDVISQARLWHRMYGIKLLVVDYLQLMGDSTKKNTVDEVTSISRKMKLLAKELQIPVVLLSQLSRKVEERTSKRPRLSDLRESGAIEQDADVVMFLYRPGYYGIDVVEDDMLQEGTDSEIIFAKYRAGSVGTICLKWVGDKTKYVDPKEPKDKKYFDVNYNIENNDVIDF